MKKDFLLGNGAIALGLVEAGCEIVTAYPGTPSSEIIPEILKIIKIEKVNTYIEWSTNEKVAFDNAFAAAITGKRAACCMKQVGLNVASDSLMSSAYLGTKGGFLIISCDDPGPHSSQTEQDSRIMARLAKIPVFDPSLPDEARKMIGCAFEISEEFEIPVILRPTTRVCHSKQVIKWDSLKNETKEAIFIKNPTRWAATPKYRLKQHKLLNLKLKEIESKFNKLNLFNKHNLEKNKKYNIGIISSGVASSIITELLAQNNITDIPILKIGTPYPLPNLLVTNFTNFCKKILIVEETDSLIELLINNKNKEKIFGRLTNNIPTEGELTPEQIETSINNFLFQQNLEPLSQRKNLEINKNIDSFNLPKRKPSLCAGCPHRASFFAIRKAQPKAIFTSDIGCYTLGINMGCVDTCLDMGAAITLASGFFQSFKKDKIFKPIIATIGDSTFIHSGTAGLLNAVYNKARFVLVILDNGIVAMTGMQPSPPSGILADGSKGKSLSIEKIVEGCGVNFIKTIDPYNISKMILLLKQALLFAKDPKGGIAVIIAKHPCLVKFKPKKVKTSYYINEKCEGCNLCLNQFQCPAINKNLKTNKIDIDKNKCIKCGVCTQICPKKAIVQEKIVK